MKLLERAFFDSEYKTYSEPIKEFVLSNDSGMTVCILNYGGIITDIRVPDKNGTVESVVLGFDDLAQYRDNSDFYFGAIVGRVAGRISNAQFTLNGETYNVIKNDGKNSLHGGGEFSESIWKSVPFRYSHEVGVTLTYSSPSGSMGFPGKVDVSVTYTLNSENQLSMSIEAVSSEDTILNITNHSYFNMSGNNKRDICGQKVCASVSHFGELDGECIPSGRLLPVEGTPFNFNDAKPVQAGIESGYAQNVVVGNSYDHPFVFSEDGDHTLSLTDDISGRTVSVSTDYPAIVMYTCGAMRDGVRLSHGKTQKYLAAAIEPEYLPDAVNHEGFGDIVFKAGRKYKHNIKYTFSVNS